MATKEAQARIKINHLLEAAGWRLLDGADGPANVCLEQHIKLTQRQIESLGDNFEHAKGGYIDFLLLDDRGFPFVVLEAKSEDKDPLIGKEQARRYARSLNARYIILSNGNLHYFWSTDKGNPQIITAFPSYESLKNSRAIITDPIRLVGEVVLHDYIARTQMPTYDRDPRWLDEGARPAFITEYTLRFLRDYQLRAIMALQTAVKNGQTRFLFEMATGTGKTLTAAAVIKLFLRTGNARRVLFLVDRLELENQAFKNFRNYLKNDYTTVIYKQNRDDWRKAEIVVTTVQSLLADDKYTRLFSPADFDLIISDEAHRSISGNQRAVFEYFMGYKLGLTATPRDYLKNIGDIPETDPRQWERRQLLDTYRTFGCASGQPTYQYSLLDGVRDGYLVNPLVMDARTEITTQLLADEGYKVERTGDAGEEQELVFTRRDFERTFFSDASNAVLCCAFLEKALRDPLSGEIGKTIVFCVSRKHATKVTQMLNQAADIAFPGRYQSDFAVQITSDIPLAQQMTIQFQNNNLNGQTTFLEGYPSSKTRVCLTVGMMTTGYDCEDLLNIVLLRPVFSPTDFIQIKGRGTRRWRFKHRIEGEEHVADKTRFKLFDFFATCEFFEHDFDYDEKIKLPAWPKPGTQPGLDEEPGAQPAPAADGAYISTLPDALKGMTELKVDGQGLKIDRMMFQRFGETLRQDAHVRELVEQDNLSAAEEYVRQRILDKPEEYFNLEKLRRSISSDRRITLREMLEHIFGRKERFESRDELLEREFKRFMLTESAHLGIDASLYESVHTLFTAYLSDPTLRAILDKGEYAQLATHPSLHLADLSTIGAERRQAVLEYIRDTVNLNQFLN
ncbi:MAG: DEAD/DEAH box helicase family protein [Chloroflexi bacterium]|nr:DEAD/DEAH box helicase family protein [Chloroflexota bacterium]